jgi:hypothetical protein
MDISKGQLRRMRRQDELGRAHLLKADTWPSKDALRHAIAKEEAAAANDAPTG